MRRFCLLVLLLLGCLTRTATGQVLPKPEVHGPSWVYSTEGLYHDIRDDLVTAIESRGIVVSYVAYAASMLMRTAEAVGASKQVYDNAQILLFCKADLTYELTVENPHNLTLCPYSISIYTLTDKPGTVYLAIPAPDFQVPAYAAIHQLLESIVAEALSW